MTVLFIGTVGYSAIEGYSLIDAFYMTIITVSTVGFHEVVPLSDLGKMFTSFLIIFSFGIFAYAITYITRYVVTGEALTYFKDYKVNSTLSSISQHVIVCGYGRNGRQAIKTLKAYGQPYVIIEQKEEMLSELKENNELYVKGDATSEETLTTAGIKRAKSLITTLPRDAENVFVVLTSREMNKNLTIISRAYQDSSEKKLRIAGADNVIMPDKVGGAHMASLVVTPDVYEFLDHISVMGSNEVNLEEINFKHVPEKFQHKTIGDLDKSYHTGCLIIGFRSPDGDYTVNPSRETKIVPNSKLFVLGKPEQIKLLNSEFNIEVSI